MVLGKVYKLTSSECDKIYIGSTYSPYASVRMAHHRQNHRNGWRDYQGLFDNGDPVMEILETIELENPRKENWKLRQLEESHSQNYENTINIRRCYLTPEEKIKERNKAINKYHNSPLGKLALRKAHLNQKLKKLDHSNESTKSIIKMINDEIKFISNQQKLINNEKINPH
jgi:hypothetical protein